MSTWAPFSLSGAVPVPADRTPRCVTGYDENNLTIGFVNGEIAGFDRIGPTEQFVPVQETTHKVLNGIVFGLNQVPEGHELLTETSLLVGGGDKTLRNVLTDGTELFAVGPLTHPEMAHTAAVENIIFGNDPRQTLITAGWDGQVKFWKGDEVMMSLALKNQYSTHMALIGKDRLAIGSGSKILSLVRINYDALYTLYEQRQAEVANNKSQMADVDEFAMADGNGPDKMNAVITDQLAIKSDIIQYLDFKPDAHDHAIRRVIPLYSSMDAAREKDTNLIATIGNDGYMKVWDVTANNLKLDCEIEVLQSSGDQSEFIYDSIQYFGPLQGQAGTEEGTIVVIVACDDRTVRMINVSAAMSSQGVDKITSSALLLSETTTGSFHSKYEMQYLELPAVPRTLYNLQKIASDAQTSTPSSDFIALAPSGAYTFSFDQTRWVSEDVATTFNNTIQTNIEKAKKMTNIDLETLPQPEVLLKSGVKDGEHKIVNIGGKPMVVQWSVARFEWVLIGEAMGSNNEQGQGNKKQYRGKFYDHTVEVEAGAGAKLTLAFNSDDDPYDVAQEFIAEHRMDGSVTQQIVQFILPYIDQKKLQRKREAAEIAKQNQLSQFSLSTWGSLGRSTINNALIQKAMSGRITAFVASDPTKLWAGATGNVATDKTFAHLCWVTQHAPSVQPEAVLNQKDLDALSIMLTHWPTENLTPVLDIIRVLSYEAIANNVMFNPTAAGFNEDFNCLLLSKLQTIFQSALSSTEQNAFASLSLTFDILTHAIGRRTNLRQLPSQLDLFDNALPKLFAMVTSPNSNNATISTFLTTSPTGFKLLPSIYRLVHNITAFCNRIGLQPISANAPPQTSQLPTKISSTIDQWVKWLASLLALVPVNADGAWDKDVHMYEFMVECARLIVFECDCYPELKQYLINNYNLLVSSTLPKSIAFFKSNLAKTREVQSQCNFLSRDYQIMFQRLPK